MVKKKKTVFRVGDKIKIINPEIFVRCGYPLSKKDAIEKFITREDKEKIKDIIGLDSSIFHTGNYYLKERIYEEILDRFAYSKLIDNGFGGDERKIFTQYREELKGGIFIVESKRVVQTGIRCLGYYDEDGCDPPYLGRIKSHVLLRFNPYNCWSSDKLQINDIGDFYSGNDPEIEEIYVEKVIEKTPEFKKEIQCEPWDSMKMDQEIWGKNK